MLSDGIFTSDHSYKTYYDAFKFMIFGDFCNHIYENEKHNNSESDMNLKPKFFFKRYNWE